MKVPHRNYSIQNSILNINSLQVYLPAISGYVPSEMVACISAFLDIFYLARRPDIDEATLVAFDSALEQFHTSREIFRISGVRPTGFSLPRQHSLVHYRRHMEEFGAPGGLCSSITESRHITAVKKPWRRSNRFEALGQMLCTNQRLDKLAAARADFISRNMLPPSYALPPPPQRQSNEDDDGGPVDDVPLMGNVVLARTHGKDVAKFPKFLTYIVIQLVKFLGILMD